MYLGLALWDSATQQQTLPSAHSARLAPARPRFKPCVRNTPRRTALSLHGFSYKPLMGGIDAWLEAQVTPRPAAAPIRQTSFEGSLRQRERGTESAGARTARVVSEHLKADQMGLMVRLEHIFAAAVRRPSPC